MSQALRRIPAVEPGDRSAAVIGIDGYQHNSEKSTQLLAVFPQATGYCDPFTQYEKNFSYFRSMV